MLKNHPKATSPYQVGTKTDQKEMIYGMDILASMLAIKTLGHFFWPFPFQLITICSWKRSVTKTIAIGFL